MKIQTLLTLLMVFMSATALNAQDRKKRIGQLKLELFQSFAKTDALLIRLIEKRAQQARKEREAIHRKVRRVETRVDAIGIQLGSRLESIERLLVRQQAQEPKRGVIRKHLTQRLECTLKHGRKKKGCMAFSDSLIREIEVMSNRSFRLTTVTGEILLVLNTPPSRDNWLMTIKKAAAQLKALQRAPLSFWVQGSKEGARPRTPRWTITIGKELREKILESKGGGIWHLVNPSAQEVDQIMIRETE